MADQRPIIVIAEDSAPNRKILAHLIEKLGFEAVVFENGSEAWAKISSGELKDVACIISDIMMPVMDGIEFLKHVRENEATKDMKFILVSAMGDKDNIIRARKMHVNGYILKPLTFQRVVDKLQELFPDRKFPTVTAA